MTSIELLAPARDYECAIEAIRAGADAVYIGASKYGARSAAGNSIEDIARLVDYAHLYGVRIYVTLNTILYEDELPEAERLVKELYRIGVDALIVQDMALLNLNLPPIALHASTQMNNCTPEKVKYLADTGFRQVVLARELSLEDISAIHKVTPVPLEVFVHGALCVSYSGQCYASQHCFGRSANRGECAQFCRLAFDLEDAEENVLIQEKHLLSLRDMNRSNDLRALLEAGATSLKIEGRLKNVSYVKNVIAYYRRKLDAVFEECPQYVRSSIGKSNIPFEPNPAKSFNRGFTNYFLRGRTNDVYAFDTPKSLGEEVGKVKDLQIASIVVSTLNTFHNGDGFTFFDETGKLQGFRVNRAENNILFPSEMPRELRKGMTLYRNNDQAFEHELAKPLEDRKIAVDMHVEEADAGFLLTLTDEAGVKISQLLEQKKELARSPQEENIKRQLSKLGTSPYTLRDFHIELSENWFLPSSLLAEWRRQAVEALTKARLESYQRETAPKDGYKKVTLQEQHLTYLANVANTEARAFYVARGAKEVAPAFELQAPTEPLLMTCRHCLRYAIGECPTHQKATGKSRALFLRLPDGRRFRLAFDCKQCQMKIYATD